MTFLGTVVAGFEKLCSAIGALRESSEYQGIKSSRTKSIAHHLGRLDSFVKAVDFLLYSRQKLAENLFSNFEVRPVPSARRQEVEGESDPPDPLVLLKEASVYSKGLAGTKPCIQRDRIEELLRERSDKKFDLGTSIRRTLSTIVRPIVHAEVNLLDWIINAHGQTTVDETQLVSSNANHLQLPFFMDWKYIGVSKPTCRLCRYYFNAHPSEVGVRQSHGNLYHAWRIPEAGAFGNDATAKIFEQMFVDVWNDVLRCLEQGVGVNRAADSDTDFSSPSSSPPSSGQRENFPSDISGHTQDYVAIPDGRMAAEHTREGDSSRGQAGTIGSAQASTTTTALANVTLEAPQSHVVGFIRSKQRGPSRANNRRARRHATHPRPTPLKLGRLQTG
jgi:hypothetical protein